MRRSQSCTHFSLHTLKAALTEESKSHTTAAAVGHPLVAQAVERSRWRTLLEGGSFFTRYCPPLSKEVPRNQREIERGILYSLLGSKEPGRQGKRTRGCHRGRATNPGTAVL